LGEGLAEKEDLAGSFGVIEVTHGELFILIVPGGEEWLQQVREKYESDPYFRDVLAALKGASVDDMTVDSDRRQMLRDLTCTSAQARQYALEDSGLITYRSSGTLCIPNHSGLKRSILYEAHDSATRCHFGAA
jgi:hypothetical protein